MPGWVVDGSVWVVDGPVWVVDGPAQPSMTANVLYDHMTQVFQLKQACMRVNVGGCQYTVNMN